MPLPILRTNRIVLLLIVVCFGDTARAHLGEVHPPGLHDYFPDFPLSPLSEQIYTREVLNIIGARDIEEIPDGSGRFLGMRGTNYAVISQPGQASERLYVRIGGPEIGQTEGSTSLALHPDFATEGAQGYGKFYTVTMELNPEVEADFASLYQDVVSHYVVTEWTQEDISQPRFSGSHREIMRFDQGNRFHNVNQVEFGPDGMLYIALGEDNWGAQARVTTLVHGKILRVDPLGDDSENGQYGIPNDNPFAGRSGVRQEIWAFGFRNPWRIAFDRDSEDLFAFDVGFNSIEEVSLVEPGLNYGWPAKEGSYLAGREATPDLPDPETGLTLAQRSELVDPIFELDQTDTNSILGGVVYRGERMPDLQGKVVFGSWNTRDIFAGDPETGEIELLVPGATLEETMGRYVSINEDLDGEIYLTGGRGVFALFVEPDFDDSGSFDSRDLDQLCSAYGSTGAVYDLDGDLRVDEADRNLFLEFADSLPGDVNLSGTVDVADFLGLSRNFGSSPANWSQGDINCDGTVSVSDFLQLSRHFNLSRDDVVSVPEPKNGVYLLPCLTLFLVSRRRR